MSEEKKLLSRPKLHLFLWIGFQLGPGIGVQRCATHAQKTSCNFMKMWLSDADARVYVGSRFTSHSPPFRLWLQMRGRVETGTKVAGK